MNQNLDFTGIEVLVIGDIMLDKHIWGNVQRLNPEAPALLIDVTHENYAPGGAANTAKNIASLGGKVSVLGVIGEDDAGKQLKQELEKRNVNIEYIISQQDIPTIQKVRAYAQHQQLLRFDYEKKNAVSQESSDTFKDILRSALPKTDIVVVSDYAKGVVKREIMESLKRYNKKVILDPKPSNKDAYTRVYLMTPNAKEACELAGADYLSKPDYEDIGNLLKNQYQSNILITRGSKGMQLFSESKQSFQIPTMAKDVYDVTGAGDTVVAVLAMSIAKGYSLEESATLANAAAGVVVGKLGAACISIDELNDALSY